MTTPILSCNACGATVTLTEKLCPNCGTPNLYYNEHVTNPNPIAEPTDSGGTPVPQPNDLHTGGVHTLQPGETPALADPVVGR